MSRVFHDCACARSSGTGPVTSPPPPPRCVPRPPPTRSPRPYGPPPRRAAGAHGRQRPLVHRRGAHRRHPAAARRLTGVASTGGDGWVRSRPAPRCTCSTSELDRRGLALANMGDITAQTIAGALQTGTHGTGRDARRPRRPGHRAGAGARRRHVVTVPAGDRASGDLFDAARVGLGALGVRHRGDARGWCRRSCCAPRRADAADAVLGALDELLAATSTSTSTGCRTPTPAWSSSTTATPGPAAPPPPVPALAGQRVPGEHALRRGLRARRPPPRGDPADQRARRGRARHRRSPSTPRTRSSPPCGGCASWRWSTPSRASASARRCARCAT